MRFLPIAHSLPRHALPCNRYLWRKENLQRVSPAFAAVAAAADRVLGNKKDGHDELMK